MDSYSRNSPALGVGGRPPGASEDDDEGWKTLTGSRFIRWPLLPLSRVLPVDIKFASTSHADLPLAPGYYFTLRSAPRHTKSSGLAAISIVP